MNIVSPETGGDLLRDSERNQSRKYPGRGAEQEGHSWVILECSDGGGEEHVEGKGGDDTGQASRKRYVKHAFWECDE